MFLHQKYQTRSTTTLQSYSEIEDRFSTVRNTRTLSYQQKEAIVKMDKLLSRKVKNKKCYCFQVLKQFVLYPDSSYSSSCMSVSKYDSLIFSDEALHSLLKIMETQLIQRQIWGFINLKMNKKQQEVKQFIEKSDKIVKKMSIFQKEQSFKIIKKITTNTQRPYNLSKQLIYNFTFNHPPQNHDILREKSSKIEHNISKKTVQSEREAQSAMKFNYQMRSVLQNSCKVCNCYSFCCCCSSMGYNLQQRIQYLRYLQQMVQQKQKSVLQR